MTEGEREKRIYYSAFDDRQKMPISGTELAKQMKVSRQVIVQDIALLRASNRIFSRRIRDIYTTGQTRKK